jgi:hypothetical protein
METMTVWSIKIAAYFKYLSAVWVVKLFVKISEEFRVSVNLKTIYDYKISFEKTGNFDFICKSKSKAKSDWW